MSIKLLDKTLRVYIFVSVIVLLICAPLFYFLTEKLFVEDADEALRLHKKEFVTNNLPLFKEEDIDKWNSVSRDVKIESNLSVLKGDSIFYRFYLDSLADENEPYRVLLSPVKIQGKSYTFMARINLIESADLVANIAVLFCSILILLLTGLYFITRKLTSRMWLPFYSTLAQVERFELDKSLTPRLEFTNVEEFTRLNQSLQRLLQRNLSAYRNQKEFIENAAHELQTPLATFSAKLDLLSQRITFTDEVGDTFSDLYDSISRLNRINKNLLLLSKIDNHQYAAMEEVDAQAILEKQITFFKEQAEERNIQIDVKGIESKIIRANITLFEIAINNLLLNALRHNLPHGKVHIGLAQNRLWVANSGKSASLNSERLFERFYHVGTEGGNGLGLAIVKKIADLHGWVLAYTYENEMHIFSLSF